VEYCVVVLLRVVVRTVDDSPSTLVGAEEEAATNAPPGRVEVGNAV
jgi:hypothetical protein